MTVFQRNISMPSHIGPVLGRSFYIDDIDRGAKTWDQLCQDLDTLHYRLRYWNISVSLPKSEFGKRSIPYLSHEISAEGIRATPKVAQSVVDLPFSKSHKGVLSFLGSLNYYHKFIEDFPVVASVLYELSRKTRYVRDEISHELMNLSNYLNERSPRRRWQEYDGVLQPVQYAGRVLNDSEVRYYIAEKESTSADGRCVPWGVTLSYWDIEIQKVQKDEDELAAIMGAGITPREHLDDAVETLIPLKGHL
ncbi:reverse transcriptase [Phytophthora megakarya]|uniref:Reverse transcriptase n=1 Tax=Phytophthora megakarya TaxID=4795 RepID=A0A225VPN3_9STRA|nr:reverse transcriptase [Phytophthora megakarya]